MSNTQTSHVPIPRYDEARQTLTAFIIERATATAHSLGFGWVARPDAPSTYAALLQEHRRSEATARPLPVSSLYCDDVLYQRPEINHAMRYWHDSLHVATRLSFALDDELELGLHHLDLAERYGIKRQSLEWKMLRIDLLGQNYLLGIAGRFPINQAEFVTGCLLHGLDEGVLAEARKP